MQTGIDFTARCIAAKALESSGSAFEPTQTQLDAMNSGITAADVQQINTNKTNISSITSHITFSANSKTYYLQPEQPSNPQDGDIWIG